MDSEKIQYENLIFTKDPKIKHLDKRIIYDLNISQDIGVIKLLEDHDHNDQRCFSLSIEINYDLQGRGYAKKAFNSYVDYIFNNTEIEKITNYIAGGASNIGSIRLHEKLRFIKEKSENKNFYFYSITKEEFQSNRKNQIVDNNFEIKNTNSIHEKQKLIID